jgi:hypothetical protein
MTNFLILIETLTNCNPIHTPAKAPLLKQWLFDFTKIAYLKILIESG